jgi:hypothetical protein
MVVNMGMGWNEYEGDFSSLRPDEELPLVDIMYKWLLERDKKSQHPTGGTTVAIGIVHWAQASEVGERKFAEVMIKQLVTAMDHLSERMTELLINAPPTEIKKEGG